jgi:hypothetical protein
MQNVDVAVISLEFTIDSNIIQQSLAHRYA